MAAKLFMLEVFILGLSALASNDSGRSIHWEAPDGIAMDAATAKDTEIAFQEALKEELPGLQDVKLLATTNGSKLVDIEPSVALPENLTSSDSSNNDKVSEFEKDVTDLVLGLSKGGAGATPFGGSVDKILKVISDEMIPAVLAAHERDQKELNKLAAAVKACTTTKNNAVTKSMVDKTAYTKSSGSHKTCRVTEAGLYTDTMEAWKDMKAKKKLKVETCKAFSELSKKLGEQENNKGIVSKSNGEAVETYIRRITSTICGKPGGKGKGGNGKGGFLDQFLVAKEDCEKRTKDYNEANTKFKKLDKQWHSQKLKCDNIQDAMDGAACKHAVAVKDACETFEECWKDRKAAYLTAESAVKKEEVDRKAEWRGLKRMLCIIKAFKDGKVEESEILTCKKATHETSHLIIVYPKLGSMDLCKMVELYPSTAAYKKAEFMPLPAVAKGKVDANECTGVTEISTDPAAGSPTGCKCERVALNGPYSAGAMVKCTGCNDIRRTTDKSSCPENTKLFAPQGRTDWDTFIKSASPLRAPNWIIDVTRPQNGCGGCTRHAMNSGVSAQSTWKTSDGSPWWLRSTRYNEPNGDYHANCYLDLWHTPKNADSVTWNDGSCSYHAKSYYCQAKKLSLGPKSGSPSGCLCKKVEIAAGRTYSAGLLLKCTNCLRVYKSNDKNSCPSGTKLFSPRTREDWKAFISSATPLRAPYWIVDVTRPSNGCGGCTRHAMNSGNSAQATWHTADGSPWWLRSSRYNEPNGDYRANCYLDLWATPSNENSVTMNDWNCNYHAKSYYCQSVKGKKPKVMTTTAPPWKKG